MEQKDILELFNINTLSKYEKFISMFSKTEIDMNEVLPEHLLSEYKKDCVFALNELESVDIKNYRRIYNSYLNENLNFFSCFVDPLTYKIIYNKEKNESLKNVLKTFKPNIKRKNSVVEVDYNFNSTKTGRLTVKEGSPSILLLPKRYRNIFTSRWGREGRLISIDFVSLEPRLAKKLTGEDIKEDIYKEIGNFLKEAVNLEFDRSVIKKAAISTLYGSVKPIENISKEKSDALLESCKKFFNYDKLTEIAKESKSDLFRMNYFGRPLWNLNETRENVIVNNYIQSTSVDISLMCFNELIGQIEKSYCKPIFLIHDAIIFDVHNNYYEELVNFVKKGYTHKELGNFPLSIDNFMEINSDTTSF